MLTDEEAKAAQEVAKTTREALPMAQAFGAFVARIIGGPLEQASGILADHWSYVRWERQERLMLRSEQFMMENGLKAPTRPIPLKVAVPLLQAATLEEDDELQDLWARLLVNAANADSGVEVQRSFISILEDFGSAEARLLNAVVHAPMAVTNDGYVLTGSLPDEYLPFDPDSRPQPPLHVELALLNLRRLGCIDEAVTWVGPTVTSVASTALGRALVAACTLRPVREDEAAKAPTHPRGV